MKVKPFIILGISLVIFAVLITAEILLCLLNSNTSADIDVNKSIDSDALIESFTMVGLSFLSVRIRNNKLCVYYHDSDIITEYPGNHTCYLNVNDIAAIDNCNLNEGDKVDDVGNNVCYVKDDNPLNDLVKTTFIDLVPSLFKTDDKQTNKIINSLFTVIAAVITLLLTGIVNIPGVKEGINKIFNKRSDDVEMNCQIDNSVNININMVKPERVKSMGFDPSLSKCIDDPDAIKQLVASKERLDKLMNKKNSLNKSKSIASIAITAIDNE